MGIPLDYETLRVIWWLLLGVLLIGFALTDGFDLGTAALFRRSRSSGRGPCTRSGCAAWTWTRRGAGRSRGAAPPSCVRS